MKSISRRTFARAAGAGAVAVLGGRRGFSVPAARSEITIRTDDAIGIIRPELHGSFAEHLGSCVYGGLWVGPNSSIPNINGLRKQAVEYLKALGVPVLRWPGGCFADDYHWRDGIGPHEKRPRRVNIHWGNYTEDNGFGTHEFIALCRAIGAEPYFAGNVGSGTPQELRDWVEYCNFPSGSTLSDERIANGSAEPFRVRYWGVGNENWGCGGNMQPDEYATQYRRFAGYLRTFGETRPFLVACGPNSNNTDWTRRFFTAMPAARYPQAFAMHFYSSGRAPATKFTPDVYEAQMQTFVAMERAVVQQRALMDGFDPERRCGLLIDEWGVWDRMVPDEEKRYGRLWQQITIRSAVAAALGLNVFQRQAEKLVMGNIAQTVNVLHSVLLTHEDHCIRTPAYYAFELEKPHRGNTAVHVDGPAPGGLELSVSASRRDGALVLTLVNPKLNEGVGLTCGLNRGSVRSAKARTLQHSDMNACNTFERPDTVVPREQAVKAAGSRIEIELPPLSVTTVEAQLA